MSHTAASADVSAEAGTRPAGPAKRQRVWQLVSELLRVLVSRDAAPVAALVDSSPAIPLPPTRAPQADPPQPPLRPRIAAGPAPMSRVWQDVQARALGSRLKPRPIAAVATPIQGVDAAVPPMGSLEQNLDWRPFLLARIHDDFTHSSQQSSPD